jgi:hypothetical protein
MYEEISTNYTAVQTVYLSCPLDVVRDRIQKDGGRAKNTLPWTIWRNATGITINSSPPPKFRIFR